MVGGLRCWSSCGMVGWIYFLFAFFRLPGLMVGCWGWYCFSFFGGVWWFLVCVGSDFLCFFLVLLFFIVG